MDNPTEVYDLLILVDSTYSMENFLASLRLSLLRIIPISTLTDCFARIGLLAYKDYCDKDLLNWSGWLTPSATAEESTVDLVQMVKRLEPFGGGDGPEATKTGLARAYELMREDATTIIFLYTDAPPHTFANGSVDDRDSFLGPELSALKVETSFGGFGPHFQDWVSAANILSGRVGTKKAQIFGFLDGNMRNDSTGYYLYLCAMTDGACFQLENNRPANISKVTVEILLAWMGAEKAGTSENTPLPASLVRYVSVKGITTLKDEVDPAADRFFSVPFRNGLTDLDIMTTNVSTDTLKMYLPKKKTLVEAFEKRYAANPQYKIFAVKSLGKLIREDVAAISLNPVFGSLWRAVCNDRENEARDELIKAFGFEVDRIADADEKARVKAWLEESYDYTAEVLQTINSVPLEQQFPCVCLDPTLAFVAGTAGDDDDTEDDGYDSKAITSFRRDELLEIGRSCDYKVLRRLGRILTRLTYINSAGDMPTHIANAPETDTPRIPMALATAEHKHRFWKILLHLVVPGTMLSARPAALLAALSIRIGVKPLLHAADNEMLPWRGRWNDPNIPEIWNVNCLSLLLDADERYRARVGAGKSDENEDSNTRTLLLSRDRALFERLVSYKMLEFNLGTTLTARVGWKPEKTKVALGPSAVCKSCEYPRSVTIMGADGKCGVCLWSGWDSEEERLTSTRTNVTKDDTKITPISWVECTVRTCRAQYVVYNPDRLNDRPKCYYCRSAEEAPVVECSECLSRIIWPMSYRPDSVAGYVCHLCTSGHKTIVEVETTASELSKENTYNWLVRNDGTLAEPFNNQSLYLTVSAGGAERFCQRVQLFPSLDENLTLGGRLVRNLPAVIQQLQHWVSGRRTELGTCSLCFSAKRKMHLMLACGRRGCHQRICRDCSEGWYGLNAAGRIINTAALSCPFCRRAPTAPTLARYGMGIHAVGNLQTAVEERGTWIYGWCLQCGLAQRLMERVCAAGTPPEWRDWVCDHCQEMAAEWANKPLAKVKACPGCGTMTEKTRGCNHIACTVAGCAAHWCFLCGDKFDAGTIYPHLNEVHGGYYGNGGDDDEDDEDDEDEEDEDGEYI